MDALRHYRIKQERVRGYGGRFGDERVEGGRGGRRGDGEVELPKEVRGGERRR